ncbi:MAG: methyltransferase domain-containing protein [Actinoallomurus sp.]
MPPAPHRATLARSVRLLRAFRDEQSDPEGFYRLLAADTIAQLGRYITLDGATVADVGSGPGFFTAALRDAGARSVGIECDAGEMSLQGAPPPGSVLGTALSLPLGSGSVDVCFSSNVLEHVPDPWRIGDEMIRVVRPGGVVLLAFTNWLSPWGGHETSPWHYLGGDRAARRYERSHGRPPKNRYGHSLHPVSVGAALSWAYGRDDVTVESAAPRYLPGWASPVVRIPGVREILTWNLLLVLRKAT